MYEKLIATAAQHSNLMHRCPTISAAEHSVQSPGQEGRCPLFTLALDLSLVSPSASAVQVKPCDGISRNTSLSLLPLQVWLSASVFPLSHGH